MCVCVLGGVGGSVFVFSSFFCGGLGSCHLPSHQFTAFLGRNGFMSSTSHPLHMEPDREMVP